MSYKNYSIIIPVYNEIANINQLLSDLKCFAKNAQNEIIIIDDGSNDGTELVLKKCSYINLLVLDTNNGKGVAIKAGLHRAQHNKIILFDGDLELSTNGIKKLMILDKKKKVECVFGSRYKNSIHINNYWDFGNYAFTTLFNYFHKSNVLDSLCCAKAFYKSSINLYSLTSQKFGIDIEITRMLTNKFANTKTVHLKYNRRSYLEGKKLNLVDGWSILKSLL